MPRGSQRARACGDSARATAASQAHGREFDSKELSSLLSATRAIANEVVQGAKHRYSSAPAPVVAHALIIDGRELKGEHRIPVFTSSRAAQLLKKDPRGFGAAVKQLYLSGPAGGAGLRELLAYNESMDTDQPELDSGVASGGATPTCGRGARDAAG